MPVNRRWQAAIGTVLLLWGCTSDNALTGPVEVEFERPWITIDSPAEGTIGDDGSVMVAGTFGGDVEGVSVNGVEATVEENTFSAEVSIDSEAPYTALLAEARGPGGWARDRQTYLRGGREAATATVPQGMALRLTDGGIDGLQGYVTSTVTPALVEQGIVDTNPLYSGDIVGTTVVLDATSASIDGLYLDLDARSNGVISQVTLTEISIAVELDTDWAGVWYGTVSLAALAMESRIRLTAEDGALVVEPRDVTVELFDLQIDFEGIWSWIEDGLESYVQSMMEETVAEAISQEVADALNGALAGLQSSFDFGTASIGGSFRDVVHDDDGINVQLDLELDATGDVPQYRVAMAGQPPEMSGSTTPGQQSYGAQVVLDDDALNAIGVAVYASGLMTQHLEGELPGEIPLELTASMFTTMFPSLEDAISPTAPLVVDTAPAVPLVGRAAEGPEGVLDLYLPGFWVTFSGDTDGDGSTEPLYLVAIDTVLHVDVDAEDGALNIYADEMDVTLIACGVDECDDDEGDGLDDLLKVTITLGLGALTDGLTEIIDGMLLVALEGGECGPNSDHAALYADLIPAS